MDNKKFEQLIDMIINENEEQARALFHDIVVEKSREIYESLMDEEMDEGMGGQVGQFMDEISAEEEGMTEEDESEFDDEAEEDGEDFTHDLEADHDEMGEEDIEDRVVDLEDKLDQLMAEFEDIMAGEEGEEHMDDEMSDEEGAEDFASDEEDSEEMMEAVQLQKVSLQYPHTGENGDNTKTPTLANSGQAGMDSKPVKFSGSNETVPTSPKGASNAYAKGETTVKGAGSFKNSPGQKKQDLSAAPKPVKTQASGVNTKSPVSESRTTKRRI